MKTQGEMIECPCQDLFPYINDAMHEKLNTEWNNNEDKLAEIKSDTWSWNENNRCKKVQTVINRLGACHT